MDLQNPWGDSLENPFAKQSIENIANLDNTLEKRLEEPVVKVDDFIEIPTDSQCKQSKKEIIQDNVIPNPLFGFDPWSSSVQDSPVGSPLVQESNTMETNIVKKSIDEDDIPLAYFASDSHIQQSIENLSLEGIPRQSVTSIQSTTKDTSIGSLRSVSIPTPVMMDPLNVFGVEEPEQQVQIVEIEPIPLKKKSSTYEFICNVIDHIKVGGINSFIEYRIRTKTNHPNFRNNESSVMRRFSDFLWLFNQLLNEYPGVIIPPVPDKMALGRFQQEFIESRKSQLDIFLKRIVSHPILQMNTSLQMFLESETFSIDKKGVTTRYILGSEAIPMVHYAFPPVNDDHPELEQKRNHLVRLEMQLKNVQKIMETMLLQRQEMIQSLDEMGDLFVTLGLSKMLGTSSSDKITKLGGIHKQIRLLYQEQSNQDITHVVKTCDELLRTIGSIKLQDLIRHHMHKNMTQNEIELQAKKQSVSKYQLGAKVRTDKISTYSTQVQQQAEDLGLQYQKSTNVLLNEISDFDVYKLEQCTDSVKVFISKMLQTQEKCLVLWKSI